jgi:hypothetical protein
VKGQMMLIRFQNWPELLAEKIERSRELSFAWGIHDCALFCADAIFAMTGIDLASDLRGTYKTEKGAQRRIRTLGFESLEALVSERLESIPIVQAGRGDLVLHHNGALGICDGLTSWFVTPSGLTRVKTLSFEKAWRV